MHKFEVGEIVRHKSIVMGEHGLRNKMTNIATIKAKKGLRVTLEFKYGGEMECWEWEIKPYIGERKK